MDNTTGASVEVAHPPRDASTAPGANAYIRLLLRLEQAEALDRAIRAAEPFTRPLVRREPVRRFFHGDATGIPLHVILTDLPLGAWFMAQFLDMFRDAQTQRAATRLVGLGVLTSVPTAVAGWAEWAPADVGTRRVGIVHATVNAVAVLVFVGSWAARLRDHHALGVRVGRLGGVVLVLGGFLGGHMDGRHRAG